MTEQMPSKELIEEVRDAVAFSYQAGVYPEMSSDAEAWMAGDGGLLHSLNLLAQMSEELERTRRDAMGAWIEYVTGEKWVPLRDVEKMREGT